MLKRLPSFALVALALALCFAILVLPAQGAAPSRGSRVLPAQATADPCVPQFAVEGIVLSDQFVYDQPSNRSGLPVLKVLKTNRVEVLGRDLNGFWALIRGNTGIVGWIASPQLFVDPKQYENPKIVPVVSALPTATPTSVEPTIEPTSFFDACPGVNARIVADSFRLRVRPASNADSVGVNVTLGEDVQVIASNIEESWVLVQNKDGVTGWVLVAYVTVTDEQLTRVRRDYTYYEATLTPRP
jgi:uncharacterized protein YgiM (DUF1202 family)